MDLYYVFMSSVRGDILVAKSFLAPSIVPATARLEWCIGTPLARVSPLLSKSNVCLDKVGEVYENRWAHFVI